MKEGQELELYIHIPFCVRKCNYCDFLSFPSEEDGRDAAERSAYVRSLIEEIKKTGALLAETAVHRLEQYTVRSVFIGGGTPSLLTGKQMEEILAAVRDSFFLEKEAEITTEANPGTLTWEKLSAYRQAGINRLSIGLQSADDRCLALLGRIHTFDVFLENYLLAKKAGFKNINIDLMSGLPGQSLSSWKNTLQRVTDLKPGHLSAYSLILEEGTPFYNSEEIRRMIPDEETDRLMYHFTKTFLQEKGYERYEISNYALPGKECIHNLGYWSGVPYLGFGLGAASCFDGARFSNERNLKKYLHTPYVPFANREDYTPQTVKDRIEEFMFLGLRKRSGISAAQFEAQFGKSLRDVYGDVIVKYENQGFLKWQGGQLLLTDAGIDVSDYIFCEFML